MKNLLFLLIAMPFFCLAQTLTTASTALPVNSKIERVTVFLQGAQIERKGNTMLIKGRNELIFKALSPYLDKESIRLKGDGNFTVLSVNYAINHMDEQQKRGEVETLNAQSQALTALIELENISVSAWQYEVNALQKNDVVSSTQSGVRSADLKDLMEYRTNRLRETNLKIYESNKKITEWYKQKTKIAAQLTEINAKSATFTGEITIVVNADAAGNANFDLSYSVANASWQMSYDLRVKDVASPMNLLYKANVQQQSGEDWKDVKLVFSTGNPTYNNAQPKVEPWYLRMGYNENNDESDLAVSGSRVKYRAISEQKEVVPASTKWVKKRGDGSCLSQNPDDCLVWCLVEVPAQYQTVTKSKAGAKFDEKSPLNIRFTENITNTLYEVGLPYTVLNDGKIYTAEIRNGIIPASYEYFAVPKESSDAYLTALVTNWDELQLVSGEAALYYEGTYMGKTQLNPDNTNDTLRISLGIDKGIVVQRIKLKEFAKKQVWGDKQSDERAYEIAIRNRKAQAINIIIEDQFPLTAQKEITVERMDYKDTRTERTDYKAANVADDTGKVTWKQTIEPSKERKFVLHYKIKYPKGWNVKVE